MLTLKLSALIAPRLARLHRPERLVLDLPHTRRLAALPSVDPSGAIAALRAGRSSSGALRLVLELKDPRVATMMQRDRGGAGELRVRIGMVPAAAPAPKLMPASTAALTASLPSGRRAGAVPQASDNAAVPTGGSGVRVAPRGSHEVVVVIDPGHGGVDPGATGQDGIHEKDLTLAIARVLAARIGREPGMRAVLTRDDDSFISLPSRLERARKAHADFFVSIHADSVRDPQISGASVYVLSERGASSEAARHLADEENAADLRGGVKPGALPPDLRSVLLDLSQSASIGESAEAANDVLGALAGVGAVRKREVQRAAFVVLKSPYVPSMLIETAYISNRADEQRLKSPAEQQRLAEAIFAGIASYFRRYPPAGSLFAHTPALAAPASS
jgi:N-acetylmuramoyl-L-alanine amidase